MRRPGLRLRTLLVAVAVGAMMLGGHRAWRRRRY